MEILPFRTPGLGDQTYLLTHEGKGVLVDPQRDIDRFLRAAAERDVELRFVLETHLHNDYVSGGEQAALRTGAELVLPAAAAPAYPHTPAFHLEDIEGGDGLSLRPIQTPGHTPEHTSYLVLIEGEPVAVFSGGSLLAGGVVLASIVADLWLPGMRFAGAFVGAGLVFAGLTDTCAMGMLLARLPYNRGADADVDAALACIRRPGSAA
ncbi:MBL fold metallo-hydrolase [Microbispora siamensis]